MTTVFEIGGDGVWTGATREIAEEDGILGSWTRSPVPTLAAGEIAAFDGIGWRIVTEVPRPILPDLPLKKFRRALIEAGLFAGVEAAIDTLDEPARALARNEFEHSVNVVRTDPWVAALAPALELTDTEIDTLWTWAAGL